MITVTTKVHFRTGKAGRKRLADKSKPTVPEGRVPRVSKLMALAIRFDGLLRDGVVSDLSELARLARVTQPRMTQIMNLLHLAPDIQEELLFLPLVCSGSDIITERTLRIVSAELSWWRQRAAWHALVRRLDEGMGIVDPARGR
jgi:hypothetical protein